MNFKKLASFVALGLAMTAGASTYANAATKFDFSYAFHGDNGALTGDTITGSFYGALTSGVVTNISNVSAVFDGTALTGPLEVYSYTPTYQNCGTADCYTRGGATASFDGLANNFVFIDSPGDSNGHLTTYSNYFYVIQPWANGGPGSTTIATQFSSPTAMVENYNGDYYASSFVLTAVPEPATWALLFLGFGSIGWILRGSRRQRGLATV